jgi:hypothetical protein
MSERKARELCKADFPKEWICPNQYEAGFMDAKKMVLAALDAPDSSKLLCEKGITIKKPLLTDEEIAEVRSHQGIYAPWERGARWARVSRTRNSRRDEKCLLGK